MITAAEADLLTTHSYRDHEHTPIYHDDDDRPIDHDYDHTPRYHDHERTFSYDDQDHVHDGLDLASDGLVIADLAQATPLSVVDWSTEQRVQYALQRMMDHLPGELRRQLDGVLISETLAWMVGIFAVWIAGQALGYREVADVGPRSQPQATCRGHA